MRLRGIDISIYYIEGLKGIELLRGRGGREGKRPSIRGAEKLRGIEGLSSERDRAERGLRGRVVGEEDWSENG